MKMNFKYAMMACAALAMGFSSCSNDNEGITDVPAEEGAKTYFQINVKAAEGAATRAYQTHPATDAEQKIKDVKIFIFNSNKILEEVVTIDGYDKDVHAPHVFETTIGTRYFLAVANAPTDVTIPVGTHIDSMDDLIRDMNAAKLTTFTTDNQFFMTSGVDMDTNTDYSRLDYAVDGVELVEATEAEALGGKNLVTISIGRAVGKVELFLGLDPTDKLPHSGLNGQPVGGYIDWKSIKYMTTNNPDGMYYFPYFGGREKFQTPYFDMYGQSANGKSAPKTYFPLLHSAAAADYANLPKATPKVGTAQAGTPSYVVENSNEDPTYGNATIISIQAVFIPAEIDGAANTTAVTFWRAKDNTTAEYLPGFYSTKALAEAAATAAAVTEFATYEYENGICYYIIPIENSAKSAPQCYDVVRNHYYEVNINDVYACGYSEPGGDDDTEDKDPLDPTTKTYIHAEINVLSWYKVTQSGGLGPR